MVRFHAAVTVATALFVAATLHALSGQEATGAQAGDSPLTVQGTVAMVDDQEQRTGVFTERQVSRGERDFQDVCSACHEPSQFAGPAYMDGWSGQSVGMLVQFIEETMPEDNPGGLSREQYVDIVSYIFSLSGLPTGDSNMPTSTEDLDKIMIEGPFDEYSGF